MHNIRSHETLMRIREHPVKPTYASIQFQRDTSIVASYLIMLRHSSCSFLLQGLLACCGSVVLIVVAADVTSECLIFRTVIFGQHPWIGGSQPRFEVDKCG